MYISRIEILKLFGLYDYDILLINNEPVTIIHAGNGRGKTTILKLIDAIINFKVEVLDDIPFLKISLFMDNQDIIAVEKNDVYATFFADDIRTFRNTIMHDNASEAKLSNMKYYHSSKGTPVKSYEINIIPDSVEELYRKGYYILRRLRGREHFSGRVSILDVINTDIGEDDVHLEYKQLPFLKHYQKEISVNMIQANRIYSMNDNISFHYGINNLSRRISSITQCADDLLNRIRDKKSEKARLADQLDRTFPTRLLTTYMDDNKNNEISSDDIKKKLESLNKERMELQEIGLLDDDENDMLGIGDNIPQEILNILLQYIQDVNKKFSILRDIKSSIDMLLRIINDQNKLYNKKLVINSEKGLLLVDNNNREIPLDRLSSGEKNIIILFYKLIFFNREGSLILIDEPEISQHILWQEQFIEQLYDVCKKNNMRAIVSTHSPNIVNEKYNLLVNLNAED